mmetsp:Transcript_31521/g.80378  ORF Transcript_31521/g.80378 Transcript_31521/m.80378 type:complete len:543 (+) Transcript_31521:132-1760(+)
MAENEGDEWAVAEQGDFQLAEFQPIMTNSMGVWDGLKMYLRSFAVWYRWWQVPSVARHFNKDRPEEGYVNGMHYHQSMGKMTLWWPLEGTDADLTEDDLLIMMSCWEISVHVGRDLNVGRTGKISGGRIIGALSGEFFQDVMRKLCWWEVVEHEDGSRWLAIYLYKQQHKAWKGPWYTEPLNFHKKSSFPWSDHYVRPKDWAPDENLSKVEPGVPQNMDQDLCTAMVPERLCTGIDAADEDENNAWVLVHLDEEALHMVTSSVPMEEIFAADVESDSIAIFLRNEGFGVCWGKLKGLCVPELTTWEITSLRRKNLPPSSNIKCPAFYNPTLRITLTKAGGYQNIWGGVFAEMQSPNFAPPRERMPWTERIQRALVLSPGAPLKESIKADKAKQLCTRVEATQDTVLQKATLMMHLQEGLHEIAFKFKLDLGTFFSMKVAEKMLEVSVIADTEYVMCVGRLGGDVQPSKTAWEIAWERDSPNSEKGHLCLKISLTKAPSSKGKWDEVFRKMEPWEVCANIHKNMALEAGAETEAVTDDRAEQE